MHKDGELDIRSFIEIWKAAGKAPDDTVAAQGLTDLAGLHFDVTRLTDWKADHYVNGVQDLECKDELRRGGRCEMITEGKTRVPIFWRSNQALKMFQWMTVDEASRLLKDSSLLKRQASEKKREKFKNLLGMKTKGDDMGEINLNVIEFREKISVTRARIDKGAHTALLKEAARGITGGKIRILNLFLLNHFVS